LVVLKAAELSGDPTNQQLVHVEEKRLALRKQIVFFRSSQICLTPEVSPLVVGERLEKLEEVLLQLPHSLLASHIPLCDHTLTICDMEAQLRYAQAMDALEGLRRSIAVFQYLCNYRRTTARGQAMQTRTTTLIESARSKKDSFVARYRRARAAYLILKGSGDWEKILQVLDDSNVRSPANAENERTGEGFRTLSWIYTISGATETEQLQEGDLIYIFVSSPHG
jgi:hypothetical protein